jgi:hypothetical protein
MLCRKCNSDEHFEARCTQEGKGAGKGSGSGSSCAAWTTNVNPNSISGSQTAEIGGAVGLPWSDNDLMFEPLRPTSTLSFFPYLCTYGEHFPQRIHPWFRRNVVEAAPSHPDIARAILNDDLSDAHSHPHNARAILDDDLADARSHPDNARAILNDDLDNTSEPWKCSNPECQLMACGLVLAARQQHGPLIGQLWVLQSVW